MFLLRRAENRNLVSIVSCFSCSLQKWGEGKEVRDRLSREPGAGHISPKKSVLIHYNNTVPTDDTEHALALNDKPFIYIVTYFIKIDECKIENMQ